MILLLLFVLAAAGAVYQWRAIQLRKAKFECHCPPRPYGIAPREHAVIVGGGMSGMTSAAMLSKHFKRVTVLERFKLPEGTDRTGCSKGRPQCLQIHGLVLKGLHIVEHYLPGFTELVQSKRGSSTFEWLTTFAWISAGKRVLLPEEGTCKPVMAVAAARAIYDSCLLQLTSKIPNVEIIPEANVLSLIMEGTKCVGVTVRIKGDHGTKEEVEIRGEIVVNCSGRNGNTVKWMEDAFASAGMEMPKYTTELRHDQLHYATATFQHREGLPKPAHGAFYEQPDWYRGTHKGVLYQPAGEGRVTMLRFGYGPDVNIQSSHESTHAWVEGFTMRDEFRKIFTWDIVEPWLLYNDTPQYFRHFEEMEVFLENFYCLGASVVKLDPSYGQGMTHALVTVRELEKVLVRRWLEEPCRDYCGTSRELAEAVSKLSVVYYAAGADNIMRPFVEDKAGIKDVAQAYFMYHFLGSMFSSLEGSITFNLFVHGLVTEADVFRPRWMLPALWLCAKDLFAAAQARWKGRSGASQTKKSS